MAGVAIVPAHASLALLAQAWQHALDSVPTLRPLAPALEHSLLHHGDVDRWLANVDALPALAPEIVDLGPTITVGRGSDITAAQRRLLRDRLLDLAPWRKGPFALFGIHIDSEWRSDWKWHRVAPHVCLEGRRVLDVGCGNGYYGWRMCSAGAALVIGIDPTPLYVCQYAALLRYLAPLPAGRRNVVLPMRLEAMPAEAAFDTVFSMGVLYHRRDPAAHLRELHAQLNEGGQLVLETLVLAATPDEVLTPPDRYAGMRNVWHVPGLAALARWLTAAGFRTSRCVDVTATTVDEQRATVWMPQRSLADALDPTDTLRTIEGLPAPVRAIVIAEK